MAKASTSQSDCEGELWTLNLGGEDLTAVAFKQFSNGTKQDCPKVQQHFMCLPFCTFTHFALLLTEYMYKRRWVSLIDGE